jgi:hypothetical protein
MGPSSENNPAIVSDEAMHGRNGFHGRPCPGSRARPLTQAPIREGRRFAGPNA